MSLKKSILALTVVALPLGVLNAAPKRSTKAAAAPAAATAATFKVDPKASSLKWTGKKITGQHHGTIQIKDGELSVVNGALTGGKFTIDTASLDDEDLGPDMKPKLVGHLKSDAFFNVEKYPTSLFVITSIAPLANGADGATHTVSGDLTIKDITKPLSFPAKIVIGADTVTAEAKNIAVDRTLYDIRYGSGKFFQGLGDKVISDQFWLDVSLVAKK